MRQNTPEKSILAATWLTAKRSFVYGGLIALVILFLVLLSGTVHAADITDCAICQIYNGDCSEELVQNYADKLNLTVEWICLRDSVVTSPVNLTDPNPIHAVAIENYSITYFMNGSATTITVPKNLDGWSYKQIGDSITIQLRFNASAFTTTSANFEVYTALPLVKNNSNLSYNALSISFEGVKAINKTAYGYAINSSFTSRSGSYTINITASKLSSCIVFCSNPIDYVYIVFSCTQSGGCLNRYLTTTFQERLGVWDTHSSCNLTTCLGDWQSNQSGSYAIFPQLDLTKTDCNNVGCFQKYLTIRTYYYKTPRCNVVQSATSKGVMITYSSTTVPYSCINNTAPVVTLVSPLNNSDNTTPVNFTFYAVDNQTGTYTCKLYLNDTLTSTKTGVANNTNTTFLNINFTAGGNYSWYVNCTDAGTPILTGRSATWYLNVTVPVPEVTPSPAFVRSRMLDYFMLLLLGDRRVSEDSVTLEDNLLLMEVIALAAVISVSVLFALASRDYAGLVKRKV